jgi:hypothetical protein
MVIRRGQIWWADLPEPAGSGPGYRRHIARKDISCLKAKVTDVKTGRKLQQNIQETIHGSFS